VISAAVSGPPAADAGAPASDPPAAPDAGTPDAPPAADACSGLLPSKIPPGANIVLCGAGGTSAAFAFGDAHGAVALGCASHDVGPGAFFSLFLPMPSGFVSKAPLGFEVWPQPEGFAGASRYPDGAFELHERDGAVVATQAGAHVLAGPSSLLIASVSAAGISVQQFGGAARVVASAPANVSVGGAGDVSGNTLLIWQTYGEAGAHARWLGPDGAPITDAFAVAAWMQAAIRDPVALAGGGLAMRTYADPMWRGVVRTGATAEDAPPSWLASRGGFFLARGGAAMVFGDEVLAAGGTSCGKLDLGAPLIGVGLDGTAVTAPDQKTFRIFPQLLQ